jgi:flagellar motor switch protein FliN
MTTKSTTEAADQTTVSPATFPDLGAGTGSGDLRSLSLLGDVALDVTVELGRIRMRVRDVLGLREGTVVELDRSAGAAVDVLVNGTLVARGDVVVVDDELGVRITEVVERS